jgi:hypothetical protein
VETPKGKTTVRRRRHGSRDDIKMNLTMECDGFGFMWFRWGADLGPYEQNTVPWQLLVQLIKAV